MLDRLEQVNVNITFKEQLSLYLRNKRPKYPVMIAEQNSKLHELSDNIRRADSIKYIDLDPRQEYLYFNWAYETYSRSIKLVFLEALYSLVGIEELTSVKVLFTYGDALYIEVKTRPERQDKDKFVAAIKEKMQETIDADFAFKKKIVSRSAALEHFKKIKMPSKVELLTYRRVSTVTLSCLKEFATYLPGDIAYSTGDLKVFDLIPFENGMLLLLPDRDNPTQVSKVSENKKIYNAMHDAIDWGDKVGINTVADLNSAIVKKEIDDVILLQESAMERQIVTIADEIYSKKNIKFILVAGPSSSGKTSFALRLAIQLKTFGLKPHTISMDNYFINRADMIPDKDGKLDFETIDVVDIKTFTKDMNELLEGKLVELPEFNFVTGEREYNNNFLRMRQEDILIIEGIHCLNPKLSEGLPEEKKYRVYVNPLTQIRLDEDNNISVSDIRLLRRMCRDDRTRGRSATTTIEGWGLVRKGELKNIFPFQENANVIVNTSLIYELLLLKPFVEPLLYGVYGFDIEYIEAQRLLKFLDFFLSYNDKTVPVNSIVKEFIGGSYFKV